MSPAKHSYAPLPKKCDYRTDRHTHRRTDSTGQSDPYVPLCFAGDTKSNMKKCSLPGKSSMSSLSSEDEHISTTVGSFEFCCHGDDDALESCDRCDKWSM